MRRFEINIFLSYLSASGNRLKCKDFYFSFCLLFTNLKTNFMEHESIIAKCTGCKTYCILDRVNYKVDYNYSDYTSYYYLPKVYEKCII